MRIGLLAFSSNTGLGYQTRDFYNHLMQYEGFENPHKVLISDLSIYNNMPVDHSWAYQPRICIGKPSDEDCEWLTDNVDVVFMCETPLNYNLISIAARKGVKTVLQYNFEFLDYFQRDDIKAPTVLAAPSLWGIDQVRALNIAPVEYLPVPVDTAKIPFRELKELTTFVHIAGRPAVHDRNGTIQFLNAARNLGKEFKYRVYIQPPTDAGGKQNFEATQDVIIKAKNQLGNNLEIIENTPKNEDMYSTGEVLVLPRKYGGLCLPMWEGLSAGMPVIMTNTSPNDGILPRQWLCQCRKNGSFMTKTEISLFEAEVYSLAGIMKSMKGQISEFNKLAREIAEKRSWENSIKDYEAVLS